MTKGKYTKPSLEKLDPNDPRAREAYRQELIAQLTTVKNELLQTVVELSGLIARLERKPKLSPPRIAPTWERGKHVDRLE